MIHHVPIDYRIGKKKQNSTSELLEEAQRGLLYTCVSVFSAHKVLRVLYINWFPKELSKDSHHTCLKQKIKRGVKFFFLGNDVCLYKRPHMDDLIGSFESMLVSQLSIIWLFKNCRLVLMKFMW